MKKKEKINNLDLKNWKKHKDIITDSLWLIDKRDNSGAHKGSYHGNFVPQIPNQLIKRFTKKNDVVLDAFLGSGTTLIECKRLKRNGIGIELISSVAKMAKKNIEKDACSNKKNFIEIIIKDSTKKEAKTSVIQILNTYQKKDINLIILHPPYHDIIKFSSNKNDLSNAKTVKEFINKLGDVVANFTDLLKENCHLAIIIGDKYTDGEWIPLGFYALQEIFKREKDLKLKSILVKNMVNSRAKRNLENLWRYRALAGGFYIFKHEYILLFKKSI